MIVIIATFTGTTDKHYLTGETYRLMVTKMLDGKTVIVKSDETGMCPYESAYSFLKNWTHIQVL